MKKLERAEVIILSYEDYYGVDELSLWKPRTKKIKIEILNYSDDFLEFEVDGETHTILNPLRMELMNIDGVIFVAYKIVHPLFDKAKFVVRTDKTKIKALDALKLAKENVKKKVFEVTSKIREALKSGERKPDFLSEEEYRKLKSRY